MNKNLLGLNYITAGFTSVLVGYTSSVILILQAASAAGASPEQIESWLLTLGICMGVTSIAYSWAYKTPILTAWSTPGAAILIGSASEYEMPEVIGAFVFSGLLIFLTGLVTPISRALQRIPTPLATALLAAILLPFCIQAFEPVSTTPAAFLAMFIAFFASKRMLPKYSMLLLLLVGFACAYFINTDALKLPKLTMANPVWVTPDFHLSALLNLSLPLYLVTMLSQNLPGMAVLKSHDYRAPIKPILIGTGLTNLFAAPFGGFAFNLAAISAAICMTEEVDRDKTKRYLAVIWAGIFYVIAGLLATSVVTLFLAFPKEITQMLAGFALLGTLLMCLQNAFGSEAHREAALLTFLITLSGMTVLGISSTLWGLIAGGLYLYLMRPHTKSP